jgi:hypothetical protein
MPTTCTSFSAAMRAVSSGDWNKRADIHVEAEVGIRGGHDFRAAVVAVLAHLGDQDARTPTMQRGKLVGERADLGDLGIAAEFGLIHAGHGADDGFVTVEDFFERQGNLAQGGTGAGGFDGEGKQVAFAGFGGLGERGEAACTFASSRAALSSCRRWICEVRTAVLSTSRTERLLPFRGADS